MDWIFNLILGCLLVDMVILTLCYVGVRYIKPQWPGWWERWIATTYYDELE